MSTTSVATVFTGNSCFPYEVDIEKSFFDSDPVFIGTGFFIGTLIGLLVGLFCASLCLRDLTRSKTYVSPRKSEIFISKRQHRNEEITKSSTHTSVNMTKIAPKPNADRDRNIQFTIKRKKSPKRRNPNLISIGVGGLESEEKGTRTTYKGLSDALTQNNGAAMDSELSEQDKREVTIMDTKLREENISTLLQMVRVLLQKQMEKGTMVDDDAKDIMEKAQNRIANVLITAAQEKAEREKEIQNEHKTDPETLEVELDKLHNQQMIRINILIVEATNDIRKDITQKSTLSEEELESMMANLNDNLAKSEHHLANQRNKQALALEERLAKRRQVAKMQQYEKEQQEEEIQVRRNAHEQTLGKLVKQGQMPEGQKEELLASYARDQDQIYKQHEEQMQRQQLHLAEKLAVNRQKKLEALQKKQEEEREKFIQETDTSTNTDSVRESFNNLIDQQHQEQEEMQDVLDEKEAQEFSELLKEEKKQLRDDLDAPEDKLFNLLQSNANLSQAEAERIMNLHDAEMSAYSKSRKEEKNRMRAKMQEKLERKKQRAEEERHLAQAEQEVLMEQQVNMVKKVLAFHVDMHEDDKERILREHEQQMTKVNNQLQMSRLHQQKALEQRLNKKRAKVAQMKEEQAMLKREAREGKQKEKERMAEQLEKQIKEEEEKIENMRERELPEMHKALAEERAAALKEQEKQLSLLIGKLEVGQARRQALITRNDETLKELESKMAEMATDENDDPTDRKVDVIINQHRNQVDRLDEYITESRRRQEARLQEQLQAKRLKREREMHQTLDNQAQAEDEARRRRGVGLATSILSQVIADQQHKVAMEQLERDMQHEMMKQRDELIRELERERQVALEAEKKSFLAQLAVISNMSKEELADVIEDAVTETGGDEKEARKLNKQIRIEIKRAKTDLADGVGSNSPRVLRRARTDIADDAEPLGNSRSRSANRRKPPRQDAFMADDY